MGNHNKIWIVINPALSSSMNLLEAYVEKASHWIFTSSARGSLSIHPPLIT